jgi:hypothetical protein
VIAGVVLPSGRPAVAPAVPEPELAAAI